MSKRTFDAFLARGLDTGKANELIKAGYSLSSLVSLSSAKLKKLGLTGDQIEIIAKSSRPPISTDVVGRLLFKSRFVCCVCRDKSKSIIIHHIVEWNKSKDHSEANLVVLCLEHHSEAHSHKEHAINLSAKNIRNLKQEWEDEVKRLDTYELIDAWNFDGSRFDYINHLRLFELAKKNHVKFSGCGYYRYCLDNNLISKDGLLLPPEKWGSKSRDMYYRYEGPHVTQIYEYTSEVASAVIERVTPVNISDYFNKTDLTRFLTKGTPVFLQGAFYFKHPQSPRKGPGQNSVGYRKANKARFQFHFDAWDCTSMSSRCDRLSGRRVATAIAIVQDASEINGILEISATILAIGTYTKELRHGGAFYRQSSPEEE
ncbi:MAG: HNH endonuclease signature motif containing protein [Terriglobales bacterium]